MSFGINRKLLSGFRYANHSLAFKIQHAFHFFESSLNQHLTEVKNPKDILKKKTNSINFTGVTIQHATYMKSPYGLSKESVISWVIRKLFGD